MKLGLFHYHPHVRSIIPNESHFWVQCHPLHATCLSHTHTLTLFLLSGKEKVFGEFTMNHSRFTFIYETAFKYVNIPFLSFLWTCNHLGTVSIPNELAQCTSTAVTGQKMHRGRPIHRLKTVDIALVECTIQWARCCFNSGLPDVVPPHKTKSLFEDQKAFCPQ